MTSAHRQIADYLRRVRRRLTANALGESAGASVTAVVLGVTLGVALAGWLGGAVGWALVLAGIGASAWFAWRLWFIPRATHRSDEDVALFVEERVGGLHSAVVTTVQTRHLMETKGPSAGPAVLGFSVPLAQATAENAAASLQHYPPHGLVDTRRALRLGLSALATVTLATVAILLAPQWFSRGWAAMTTPAPSVGPAIADAEASSLARDFRFKIQPPAYLNQQPRDERSASGDIRAVAGSLVRYVATTSVPIESAVIILESAPDERWSVNVREGSTLEGELRVGTDDRYRFIATLPSGQVLAESGWRDVIAVPDSAPTVRLLLPESDLEVHAKDEVQAVFEATDDFGIARVDLVVLGATGDEVLRRSVASPQGARTARGTTSVVVAGLSLKPGDSVQLMFEVTDTNTLTGPGVALSDVRTITMYSAEREHDALLKQLERVIDAFVEVVADRLESPVEAKQVRRLSSYIETQLSISEKEALALKALDTLQVALRTDRMATDTFKADLQKAQLSLKAAHEHEAAQLQKATSPDIVTPQPSVLVQLLHVANQDATAAMEATIFELKRLLDQARQDKLLQSGREMLEAQDELRELMEKMKSGDAKAKQQALAKIAQLRQKLAKMQRDMMRLAEAVPYENQNMSQRPPGKMDEAESIEDRLAAIEKLMQEGNVEEALKKLESLNKNTQEMMAGLQNDFRRVAAPSKQGRRMAGDFQQQLNQLADGQRGINAETSEQNRQMGEPGAAQSAKAMEQARADAKTLRDKLDGIDDKALHPSDKAALDKLKQDVGRLEQQLQKMEGDSAGATAGDIAKKSEALGSEVAEGAARSNDDKKIESLEGAKSDLDQAAKAARDLASKLGQGTPGEEAKAESRQRPQRAASSTPSSQGEGGKGSGKDGQSGEGKDGSKPSEGLKALGKRQAKLAKELGGLGEALDALEQEMPGVRDQLKPKLDGARSKMEAAAKELGKGRGRDARKRQDDAQEQLDGAVKRLGEAISKRQGKGGESAGVTDPRQKVGIPGKDDVPGTFREELLKAMKEAAPERFRETIEKYYKELVK